MVQPRAPAVGRPWVDAMRLHLLETETCRAFTATFELTYAKQFSVSHRNIKMDHNVFDDFSLLVEGPSLEGKGIRVLLCPVALWVSLETGISTGLSTRSSPSRVRRYQYIV